MPARAATPSAQRLALLVLAQLHVEAQQPLDDPLRRRAAPPAPVHGSSEHLVVRDQLGRDYVHDVL